MSENLTNYKIDSKNQLVFLNSGRLFGIQSINIAQNPGLQNLSYAGMGIDTVKYIPRQEQTANVSIDGNLINQDYFLNLVTGNDLANVYIMRAKNEFDTCYNLISGYFNNFSCSYGIGSIPQISVQAIFIRDAGKIGTGQLPFNAANQLNAISTSNIAPTGEFLIPFGNNISLGIDTFNTNRLQSFDINIQSNKVPIYNMGSKSPKKIDLIYPINVEAIFSFEVGDYDLPRLRNIIQSGIIKNINLVAGDYSTNETVCNYNFNNLNLISENYSSPVDGFVTVNQVYQGKIYN